MPAIFPEHPFLSRRRLWTEDQRAERLSDRLRNDRYPEALWRCSWKGRFFRFRLLREGGDSESIKAVKKQPGFHNVTPHDFLFSPPSYSGIGEGTEVSFSSVSRRRDWRDRSPPEGNSGISLSRYTRCPGSRDKYRKASDRPVCIWH